MDDKGKDVLAPVPSLGSATHKTELIVIECQDEKEVKRVAVIDPSASCQTITEAAWTDLVACGVDNTFKPAHQQSDPHSSQHSIHGYLGKVTMDVRGDLDGYDSEQTFCVVQTHAWPIVITQSFNDEDPVPSIFPFAILRGKKDQEQKRKEGENEAAEEAREQWEKDKEELRERDKKDAEAAKKKKQDNAESANEHWA